jgi:hypothetical protein
MQQDNESRLEEGFAGALAQSRENRPAFLIDFCETTTLFAKNPSREVQIGLQRGYSRLCNFLLANGDNKGALENCEKSVRMSKELVAANADSAALMK